MTTLGATCGFVMLLYWIIGCSFGKPIEGLMVGALTCCVIVWVLGG
jgi:hypothetical protein